MKIKNYELKNVTSPVENITKLGLGFCFFNPVTESLQEFDTSTTVPILPYENTIRRYYIVRDKGLESISTISVAILSPSTDYEIKNIVGKEGITLADFNSIPVSNTNLIFMSEHTTGLIPIDVLIISKTYALTGVPLIIEITAE